MYIYIHYINIDNNYIIIYIHIYNQYDMLLYLQVQ